METVARNSIVDHFNLNDIILKKKHIFLASHSTGFQLLECVNDWLQAGENGKVLKLAILF